MNFRYPVFLDLTGKKCVVTGEGLEIAAKLEGLYKASAKVVYVHPAAETRIQEMAATGMISWEQRDLRADDLEDCFLVVTDREDNSRIFALAEARNVLCNAVDDPSHCRFTFGSVHRQGDLTIAISTNGRAPALAVRLRQWIEQNIGPEYGSLLEIMKRVRPEINDAIPDFSARRELWYGIVDSEVLSLLRDGQTSEAHAQIRRMIDEALSNISHSRISSDNDNQ